MCDELQVHIEYLPLIIEKEIIFLSFKANSGVYLAFELNLVVVQLLENRLFWDNLLCWIKRFVLIHILFILLLWNFGFCLGFLFIFLFGFSYFTFALFVIRLNLVASVQE